MAKQQQLEDWKMTPKQALFVAEYLKDLNGKQAAIRAGYSEKTAEQQASRLLSNAKLQGEIERSKAAQIERIELSADRVLQELAAVAFVDIRGFYDEHGNLKAMHQLTAAQGKALAGVESMKRNVTAGDGVMDTVYKIKLWDKIRALETLAKHFGLLVDRVQVDINVNSIESRLNAARARAAERNRKALAALNVTEGEVLA
jgi:phage terminase small subunit